MIEPNSNILEFNSQRIDLKIMICKVLLMDIHIFFDKNHIQMFMGKKYTISFDHPKN